MSDDQGWGETGYNGHPWVHTPVLDAMAASGLRLDRFYAAAPVCSPTRASVMTGRHPNRSGVFSWNWSTRPEEIFLPQLLRDAGYRTGHFGKWHIGAVRAISPLSPNAVGFEETLAHDNFFEMNPTFSHNGAPAQRFEGESSEILVDEALSFIGDVVADDEPFFVVVWFGSPHGPYEARDRDVRRYRDRVGAEEARRFAEITVMDSAIGTLREGLSALGVREDTLVWFSSDNGIINPGALDLFNGGLRGHKGQLYEGGLLVPALIEWPAVITAPRASAAPVVTSDILPTLLDLLDVDYPEPERPLDGISQAGLIVEGDQGERAEPIGFWTYRFTDALRQPLTLGDREQSRMITFTHSHLDNFAVENANGNRFGFINHVHPAVDPEPEGTAAWIDGRYKLLVSADGETVSLFDLVADRGETHDIAADHPRRVSRMLAELNGWRASVEVSLTGADYRHRR